MAIWPWALWELKLSWCEVLFLISPELILQYFNHVYNSNSIGKIYSRLAVVSQKL